MPHSIQAAIPNIKAATLFTLSGATAMAPPVLAGALDAGLVEVAVGE
jgi:hypothetical protein